MVAARGGHNVALAGDLPCEAGDGAGDFPTRTPSGVEFLWERKVWLTLADLAEEHNSGEPPGTATSPQAGAVYSSPPRWRCFAGAPA